MKNTMKRAHEIKKEAAIKWNCEASEIVFSICLKMAWAEKGDDKMDKLKSQLLKTGKKIIDKNNGMSRELLETKDESRLDQLMSMEFTDEMFDIADNVNIDEMASVLFEVQSELKKYSDKK